VRKLKREEINDRLNELETLAKLRYCEALDIDDYMDRLDSKEREEYEELYKKLYGKEF